MKKMMEKGLPMRKAIAMGMHEKMYSEAKPGGKMGKKGGKGKPMPKGGRKGY